MDFSRHTGKDIAGYTKLIHDLKWNQEGNYIGMVSADKTVKVGQLDKSGAFQNVHSIPSSAQISQIHWNPQDDSRIGMCGDDKAVELWDVRGWYLAPLSNLCPM
jgi:WD40 repeat protein